MIKIALLALLIALSYRWNIKNKYRIRSRELFFTIYIAELGVLSLLLKTFFSFDKTLLAVFMVSTATLMTVLARRMPKNIVLCVSRRSR